MVDVKITPTMTDMVPRTQLHSRLIELKNELQRGQARPAELEQEEARLRQTLLRISGAVQVLTELLAEPTENHNSSSP